MREEFTPEHSAEHANRQEESLSGTDPARSIRRDTPSGNEAVQVWMVKEFLVPGMQNGQKPDAGSEPSWIGGNGEQGLGDGPKQQVVNHHRIAEREGGQLCRKRENNVAVRNGQKLPASCGQPSFARPSLAFWTVPIAAGVESDDFVRAVIAPLDVGAQFTGLARADVSKCPDLMRREAAPPSFQEFLFVLAKDIGDFRPMFVHSWEGRSIGRSLRVSKGLGIVCRCAVDTRRYRAVVWMFA